MNILILEDEKNAASRLIQLIAEVEPTAQVIAILETVRETIDWFKGNSATVKADVVLSDIQLADGLSIDAFKQVHANMPIIFTTAYDDYTLKAFKLNSIDYLLKPIDKEELKTAFTKYHSLVSQNKLDQKFLDIVQHIASGKLNYKNRFLVHEGDKLLTILTDDIGFIMADDKIVRLQTKKGQKYIIDESLDELETLLDPADFFRINRSYIAPLGSIEKISNHFNGRLKISLLNNTDNEIFVSRARVPAFKKWLNS
jgi:DNA-binding LytR/AlgR family response regulator